MMRTILGWIALACVACGGAAIQDDGALPAADPRPPPSSALDGDSGFDFGESAPAKSGTGKRTGRAEKEARRACDPTEIARASVAEMSRRIDALKSCKHNVHHYEARMVALMDEEFAAGPPCRKSDFFHAISKSMFSDEFERVRLAHAGRLKQRCADAIMADLRASKYVVSDEIMQKWAFSDGHLLDCGMGVEMHEHAMQLSPDRKAEMRTLAQKLDMRGLADHLNPIYTRGHTEVIGAYRAMCSSGPRALLGHQILVHGLGDQLPVAEPIRPVPPPIPFFKMDVPDCDRSVPASKTAVGFAVKCEYVTGTQTSYVPPGLGPCPGQPAMLGQCYNAGGAVTTPVSRGRDAHVTITIVFEGKTIASKSVTFNAQGDLYKGAVKKEVEAMLALLRSDREARSRPTVESNMKSQAITAAAAARASARAVEAPKARARFDAARTPLEREEAAAAYILAGGRDRAVLDELARLYGVKPDPNLWPWSGAK